MSALALVPSPGVADKFTFLVDLVANSVSSPTSKRVYRQSVAQFLAWWQENPAREAEPFGRSLIQKFKCSLEERKLAPRTINRHLAAVRKLAEEAAAENMLPHSKLAEIRSVKGAKILGSRTGNWLTRDQARDLLALPDRKTLQGKRDLAVLCLFLGAGLRREEISNLTVEHLEQRDGRWCLVDIVGKGRRMRTVGIPAWAYVACKEWMEAAGIVAGRMIGRVSQRDQFKGQGIGAPAIYSICRRYSTVLEVPFAPHDLRRSYAKCARKGGSDLEQIQYSLGHSSVTTTAIYIGENQKLDDAPCDYLGFGLDAKE